jgi:peptide/nickel transport system substrate-binding protein
MLRAGAANPGGFAMTSVKYVLAAAILLAAMHTGACAQTLRIGLDNDPDMLDPTLARTFAAGEVLTTVCDRLFEMAADYTVEPLLVSEYGWSDNNRTLRLKLRDGVRFHDGEKLDAAAVKFSIERHLNLPGSILRPLITPITGVEVADERTVVIRLSSTFAPLLSRLTGRAGMIVSPKAAEAAGDKFGNHPVCAGPFKFVEHLTQDRVVLERFADYWDKERVFLDHIVYRPYPDTTVRLANLHSGDLDLAEELSATDLPAMRNDARFRVVTIGGIGYFGITINLANGEGAKGPLARDPRIREAFELTIDREAINQVVYNGEQLPTTQWISPESPFHVDTGPIPRPDLAKALTLLQEAGVPNPIIKFMTVNIPGRVQVAQMIQAMAKEAGFVVQLQTSELTSALAAARQGDFDVFQIGYTGGVDPDSTTYNPLTCNGTFNQGKYCNPELDRLLDLGRATLDEAGRKEAYERALAIVHRDRPIIYLWNPIWNWAYSAKLTGVRPSHDGIIRVTGLHIK